MRPARARRGLLVLGLVGVLAGLGSGSVPAAAAPAVAVDISVEPAHAATVLGGEVTIETGVRNRGRAATGPLLAHLNVASLEDGIYVDPEDWSDERSQELSLGPGESQTLSWDIQAVNAGHLAAYVVVLPYGAAPADRDRLAVSPLVRLDVAERPTLSTPGVLPVVIGVPVLLAGLAAGARLRRRSPRAP